MLGIYNYTVIVTYLGMLTAFFGITFAIRGSLRSALICLMISGLCDMLDGKIASTKKGRTLQERRFGIQIDSLSDLVCFGVLPAVIVCTAAREGSAGFYIPGSYLLCALIRLAWFNVKEDEHLEQNAGSRQVFYGLPVTSSALILPALFGLGWMRGWPLHILAPAALVLMGAAFLTPFQLKKPALFGKIIMVLCGIAELILLLAGMDL